MGKYIDNAKIVAFSELPQIGEAHPIYKNRICIEVKAHSFTDDYILYSARYCENTSLPILDDFYINCSSWSYAVKKADLMEGKQ
jgi:hypothetical protein